MECAERRPRVEIEWEWNNDIHDDVLSLCLIGKVGDTKFYIVEHIHKAVLDSYIGNRIINLAVNRFIQRATQAAGPNCEWTYRGETFDHAVG